MIVVVVVGATVVVVGATVVVVVGGVSHSGICVEVKHPKPSPTVELEASSVSVTDGATAGLPNPSTADAKSSIT